MSKIQKGLKKTQKGIKKTQKQPKTPRFMSFFVKPHYHYPQAKPFLLDNITIFKLLLPCMETTNNDNETWKKIDGFPEYQVSTLGNVKSTKFNKDLILSPGDDGSGWKRFRATSNGKLKHIFVHVIVAAAFVEKPKSRHKLIIIHIDGNKHNNNYKNITWGRSQGSPNHE